MAALQLVFHWCEPDCACNLVRVSRVRVQIELDPGPGRYVRLCPEHRTVLQDVPESRRAPHGAWCTVQHAPDSFILWDRTCRRGEAFPFDEPGID